MPTILPDGGEGRRSSIKVNNQYTRSIKIRSATSLIVGMIIGSGIFSSPGFVTKYVGSPGATIIVWVSCGFVSYLGALCYSELGAALPFTGGETVYFERAFGRMAAFLYVWVSTTVARPAGIALSAIVFSDYTCSLRWGTNTPPPGNARTGVAIGAIAFLCLVQMINTHLATLSIAAFTILKIALVTLLCCLGLFDVIAQKNDTGQLNPKVAFHHTSSNPGDWVLAFANCLYAYNGWNVLNLTAAEVHNPAKVIPQAIQIGLLVSVVSFTWINIAYLMKLDVDIVSGSQTVAIDFTENFGSTMVIIVTVGVALASIGTCNGSLFAGAQAIRESGRSLVLPRFFSGQLQLCSDTSPTPAIALLVQAIFASVLIAVLDSFETIVQVYVFSQWIFYSLTVMALVTLRWVEPDLERPFRVWIVVPVLFVSISVFMTFVLFFIAPGTCSIAMVALLLGVPVYALHRRYLQNKGHIAKQYNNSSDDAVPLLLSSEGDVDVAESQSSHF
eukprot:m.79990 g.79990  ORF g.79990 m.79990 type:complete len:502 (+) comp25270_c3_seq1:46-1551(+)